MELTKLILSKFSLFADSSFSTNDEEITQDFRQCLSDTILTVFMCLSESYCVDKLSLFFFKYFKYVHKNL